MKTFKKVLIILLIAFGVKANAQITLLQTYTVPHQYTNNLQSVYLKHDGFKFVYLNTNNLSFYNLNLSLYENVTFPSGWLSGNFNVECISEGLFDTDTLHIDYMLENGDSVVIYKDNGNVVFRDAAGFGDVFPGMASPVFYPIISTDSGTFMVLEAFSGNELYKLPGSLPCVPGCFDNNFLTTMPQINTNTSETMKVYPNPAISYTNISYTLPAGTNEGELVLYDLAGREMKKYTVTSQVDHLRLTTSDIAAGTYFYQLSVNGNAISTKKIVVVK